jgi:hypothetical protein
LPDEHKKKAQDLLKKELGDKKWEDLSDEKKREVFQKIRPIMQEAFGGSRGGQRGGQAGAQGQRAAGGQAGAQPGGQQAAPGQRAAGGQRPGGQPGAQPAAGGPAGGAQRSGGRASGGSSGSQYTEAQLAAAKLPPPPEEDSQLDVLLRPGLLADVEIIVEQIPDAIHVPAHAVFDKDGIPTVYVQTGKRFEEREIQLLKRSESTMVIKSGLQEGDVVALADPEARPGEKRQSAAPQGGGNGSPMGGFGGGGGGGGAGGGGGRRGR